MGHNRLICMSVLLPQLYKSLWSCIQCYTCTFRTDEVGIYSVISNDPLIPGARFTKNLMPDLWQRSTYAKLVNCERLTKNHKVKLTKNLHKTYAKLRKILWPHKCCHNSIITGNYVILLTLGHFHYSLIKQEDHRIKPMTHLIWNFSVGIFSKEIFLMRHRPLYTLIIIIIIIVFIENCQNAVSYNKRNNKRIHWELIDVFVE